MYRIYSTLIEIVAAAVFIIPIWCIYNKLLFRSWKITILYIIFGFYLTAVLALVGFPNIISLKVELTVNIIPFIYMINVLGVDRDNESTDETVVALHHQRPTVGSQNNPISGGQ